VPAMVLGAQAVVVGGRVEGVRAESGTLAEEREAASTPNAAAGTQGKAGSGGGRDGCDECAVLQPRAAGLGRAQMSCGAAC
jgi:hypothetical protein